MKENAHVSTDDVVMSVSVLVQLVSTGELCERGVGHEAGQAGQAGHLLMLPLSACSRWVPVVQSRASVQPLQQNSQVPMALLKTFFLAL